MKNKSNKTKSRCYTQVNKTLKPTVISVGLGYTDVISYHLEYQVGDMQM